MEGTKEEIYPKVGESNNGQITGIVISVPMRYDKNLGYQLAIDENRDGLFDANTEHYAWMPNDMYREASKKDSIIIKAVYFFEEHLLKACHEYIIFDWQVITTVTKATKDTIQQSKVKEIKK